MTDITSTLEAFEDRSAPRLVRFRQIPNAAIRGGAEAFVAFDPRDVILVQEDSIQPINQVGAPTAQCVSISLVRAGSTVRVFIFEPFDTVLRKLVLRAVG